MQKTGNPDIKTARRAVQSSTTLNRKYVKKPAAQTRQEIIEAEYRRRQAIADRMNRERNAARLAKNAKSLTTKKNEVKEPIKPQLTAKELKERAIEKALKSAEKAPEESKKKKKTSRKISFPRIAFTTACIAIILFGIGYIINVNIPNLSLRVAALQTGFDANYPSYVPSSYRLAEITSSDGKIMMRFESTTESSNFELSEEKTSWDSAALLNNYIKKNFNADFSTIREQGLTIFMDNSKAAWVNGGIIYKISYTANMLTKKQIKNIATSL